MNSTIILSVFGSKATATVSESSEGKRTLHLTFKESGKKLAVETSHINLKAMKAESLEAALQKVCHVTGRIALYSVTITHGSKAATHVYSFKAKENQESGYGILVRKGSKPFLFPLAKVDLGTMKAKSVHDACRKAAFTGRIALAQ
jgi:hypothetical protein